MKQTRSEEVINICKECGATVYREHLDSGIARYEDGKLLCAHCVTELEANRDNNTAPEAYEPIVFDDEEPDAMSQSRIHGATSHGMATAGSWDDAKFRRPLRPDKVGGTRCRVFHCKLSEGALEFMLAQINDWLDGNDQVVVKSVNSSIGPFEGKHTEQHLIITVFY